ncbi:hypothetical protein N7G274_001640 [Stereocaulon virgatum]|uniref:Uncharacterized protein n=1 Tax=Stereocaulon virgatum TaxID=373712 RepID=A0ABR4ARU2_9LECA
MDSPLEDVRLELAGPPLDEVLNSADDKVPIELGRLRLKDAALRKLLLKSRMEDVELEPATRLAEDVEIELGRLLLVDDDNWVVEGDEVEPEDVAAVPLEADLPGDDSYDDVIATEDDWEKMLEDVVGHEAGDIVKDALVADAGALWDNKVDEELPIDAIEERLLVTDVELA